MTAVLNVTHTWGQVQSMDQTRVLQSMYWTDLRGPTDASYALADNSVGARCHLASIYLA